jgi:hypothetical protein
LKIRNILSVDILQVNKMFGTQGFSMGMGATQGGYDAGTQASPQKTKRQEEKQTCIPITARILETATNTMEGGEIQIYGEEPRMVVLVGQVESLVKQAASLEFTLNDSTGRVKARHFFPNQEARPEFDKLESGCYVSVVAYIRSAPTIHLGVQFMTMVQSADEISYHLIETAHAGVKLQQTSKDPATPAAKRPVASPMTVGSQGPSWSPDVAMSPAKEVKEAVNVVPVPVSFDSSKIKLAGDELKTAILDLLRKEGPATGELGVDVAKVGAGLEATPLADIKGCMSQLLDDGDVYTTLDDDHFLTI